MNEALVLCELVAGAVEVGRGAVSLSQHPALHRLHVHRLAAEKKIKSKKKKFRRNKQHRAATNGIYDISTGLFALKPAQ